MNKSKTLNAVVSGVLALLMSNAAGFAHERILTSNDGRTMEARLLTKTEESIGVIRIADGRWFDIPLESLSEVDREFIANWTHTADPAWNQEPLRRGMVEPVEGFADFRAGGARRQRVSYDTWPAEWVYSSWAWPVYVPRVYHRANHWNHWRFHHGCYRRPVISVTIRF